MRRKPSEYSLRLAEKQKLIAHYGLRERQLQRFVRDSHRAGMNWISELSRRLELRLDNVVFRAQMATSVQAARQMVLHKHIFVNGRLCNIPSAVLKVGDEVQVKEASKEHSSLLQAQQTPRLDLPAFIEKNQAEKAKIISDPNTADVPFNYNERLIAEYYATRGRK
jgi:small subunit ribosomal protein S4